MWFSRLFSVHFHHIPHPDCAHPVSLIGLSNILQLISMHCWGREPDLFFKWFNVRNVFHDVHISLLILASPDTASTIFIIFLFYPCSCGRFNNPVPIPSTVQNTGAVQIVESFAITATRYPMTPIIMANPMTLV